MPTYTKNQDTSNRQCFGCGNYGNRGLSIYRWMSCECDTPAPKSVTVVNKDNLSQCTNCYIPVIKSTINSKQSGGSYTNDNEYSYSNSQYLRRKCRIYNHNLPVRTSGDTVYGNCSEDTSNCNGQITYKPNNANFSTQGAVSGGERLLRLKYNTQLASSQNINTTKKEQVCNNRGQKLRQNHTVC
jgi:hypothetical protein